VTRDFGFELSKLVLTGLGLGLTVVEDIMLFGLFLFIFWPFILETAVPDLFTIAPECFISIVLQDNNIKNLKLFKKINK
jgi:hypothetical protein